MSRPALTCCTAVAVNKPSGMKWAHSRFCDTYPGVTIDTPKRHLALVSSGVDTPSEPRLAKTGDRLAHPACIAAAHDGANPCSRCSWLLDLPNEGARYTEFHLDRDDDA